MTKKILCSLFAAVVCVFLIVPLTANAAFTQRAKIVGNGVRLRRSPVNGTILELMYYGEYVKIDPDVYDPNYAAWLYVQRERTLTAGWMEWSYFEHE